MRVAALDLGSNTFLLLIAEVEAGQLKRVVCDETQVTRLGQGVNKSREFHPEALARAEQCFAEFKKLIDQHQVEKIAAVSTSAARDVKNKDEFLKLAAKYGIPVEVISGQKEAEMTFVGACFDKKNQEGLSVIDVGGGSTEIIGSGGGKVTGKSLDVGSVRLTEMFGEDIDQLDAYIAKVIEQNRQSLPVESTRSVVAVAGTPTTLAAVSLRTEFSPEAINGHKLSCDQLQQLRTELAAMNLEERKTLPGMEPKRADVIIAGTSILLNATRALKVEEIEVSTFGVRYGLALSLA